MWQIVLDRVLDRMMTVGWLEVEMPDGIHRSYGDATGQPVRVRLTETRTVRALVMNPELALGETYMNGTLTVAEDDIAGLLALVVRNRNARPDAGWQRSLAWFRTTLRRLMQANDALRARRNVAHHYDLSGQLYDLFLDQNRQYSCGYFRDPTDTLDQAQDQKMAHIAAKLLPEPGMRVLDLGCGWGGMALYLAQAHGARVLGVTLSEEQLAYATERVKAAGLADRVSFRLCDYREIEGTFDRILSVGMFEHVGLPQFDTYFETVRDRLAPNGIALIHTIGRTAEAQATNPWIAKYIFPGGYIPTMSETMASVEKARLWPADVECWRLHYAHTLRHWRDRFEARRAEAAALYDDRFVRMWRFYLAACEQTFRHGWQAVFQFQLSRGVDAVPVTRDYLYARQPVAAQQAAE